MLNRTMAAAAALMMAVSPCAAAAQTSHYQDLGAHRTGGSVGAYFRVPFGRANGERARPQFGVRMSAIHSYRDSLAPTGPVYQADALDLRLTDLRGATLLVAGRPVTDEEGRRLNALGTAETIGLVAGGLLLLVVVAVAAGGAGFPDTCPTVDGRRDHCTNP